MKSKELIIISLAMMTIFPLCKASLLDNKLNIYVQYLNGNFLGDNIIENSGFRYSSLYNNYNSLNGVSFKTSYKKNRFFSFGVSMTLSRAYNWELAGNSNYQDSNIKLNAISPIIQFHNKFYNSGIFNHCKIFLEVGPNIGVSHLYISESLFKIESINSTDPPGYSRDHFYGIKGGVGMEWYISQTFGLLIAYSLERNWISSILNNDIHFSNSQLSVGLVLRLFKDKRYFYY